MEADYIGYGVGGLGLVSLIAQGIWTKFFSTEGKASDALVQQLGERITSQESRMNLLETGLDAEREARRSAETKVYELTMRIMRLEFELKKHNIEVPQ